MHVAPFTGAEKRAGYFAEANHGTLFLDEIGDLPMSVQPKLLRALQAGEVQVVGGKPHKVDVRIIAASDAALDDREGFKKRAASTVGRDYRSISRHFESAQKTSVFS